MASPLADLDELVLKCRDEKAKSYIKEAVSCYKSGAFRSAIVSTWIAVSFDIIDKIRELSLAGDKEAEVQLKAFEKARDEGDISLSLKFEREMLDVCKGKLELISHLEFIDLARLQEDRNRCAHPSMTSDSQIFNPSAELARVHIRSAVEYLLQYPPAQGKTAMDILLKEVNSEYFPTNKAKALVVFKNSPLVKARESLVRNFTIVLLKDLFSGTLKHNRRMKAVAALRSVEELYRIIYNDVLKDKFSNMFRAIDDSELGKGVDVIVNIPESWDFLDDDIRQKLNDYVSKIKNIDLLEDVFIAGVFKKAAIFRLSKATRKELLDGFFFYLPKEVADKVVDFYVDSKSDEEVNSIASFIQIHSSDFSSEQIKRIIKAYGGNSLVRSSQRAKGLINALSTNENVKIEDFRLWVEEANTPSLFN